MVSIPFRRRGKDGPANEVATPDIPGPASGAAFANCSRVIEADPLHLEHERILPPRAAGRYGNAYKMLRTQVLRRLDKIGANSLAILGNEPGTGKTLTAINLAIATAADPDRSALLVDLDLRKPSIHHRFGIKPLIGIEDCLRDEQPLAEAMVRIGGYDRLAIVPARGRCDDSSELLAARRTQEIIREMRQRYKERILIFDLPPVLQADDALAFSRHVEAALLVVGDGRTQRQDLLRTLDLLHDLPIVGTVLNRTREALDTHHYY